MRLSVYKELDGFLNTWTIYCNGKVFRVEKNDSIIYLVKNGEIIWNTRKILDEEEEYIGTADVDFVIVIGKRFDFFGFPIVIFVYKVANCGLEFVDALRYPEIHNVLDDIITEIILLDDEEDIWIASPSLHQHYTDFRQDCEKVAKR